MIIKKVKNSFEEYQLDELKELEEEKKFFCIDTRIRDIKEKSYAINYCKTLEDDESIIVMEEFQPYIFIKYPFENANEKTDFLKEKIKNELANNNIKIKKITIEEFKKNIEEKNKQKTGIIKIEKEENKNINEAINEKTNKNTVKILKIYFENLKDYFKTKEIIKNNPQHYIELYSKTSLKKKYYVENNLTPLTLWSSNLYALPMMRVKVYSTNKIIQEDNLTYENPNILSFSTYYEEFLDKILLKDNSIKSLILVEKKEEIEKCKIITWKKEKIIGENCRIEYSDSELDLLKEFERTIALEKPIVISGYNTDEVDFPRIMKRVEKYQGKVDFKISDDFSKPYKARLGYTLNGFVHLDLKKTTKNLEMLKEYEEIHYLLEESQLKIEENTLDEIEENKLLLATTKKLYPLLVELSKITLESLFDISRFENYKFYQSYYETYTLKNKIYYEEYVEDYEEYSLPKVNDMLFLKNNNFVKSLIQIKFLYPIVSLQKNVSKEIMNCDCCKKENERIWFCEKKVSNNFKILKGIIEKYDLYQEILEKNPVLKKNTMVYYKSKVYELLLRSYEHSIRNRKSTLYFPEGDSIIKEEIKKTIKNLAEKNSNIIAFSEEYLFLKQKLEEKKEESNEEKNKKEQKEGKTTETKTAETKQIEKIIKEKEETEKEEAKEKNIEENNKKNNKEIKNKTIIKKINGIIKKVNIKIEEDNKNQTIIERLKEVKENIIEGIEEFFTKEKNEFTLLDLKEYFEQKNMFFKNKIMQEELIGGFVYKLEDKNIINYSYITKNYEYKIKEKNKFKNYCNYAILLRDTLSRKIIDLLNEKIEEKNNEEKTKKIVDEKFKEEIKSFLEKKIKKLYEDTIDYKDLIITKKLYRNLELYEKETLFVKAAEELKLLGYEVKKNSIIPYIVVEEDKKIIVPTKENFDLIKQKFFHINKEYYLYKQIYPLIKNILEHFNLKEEIEELFYKIKMTN